MVEVPPPVPAAELPTNDAPDLETACWISVIVAGAATAGIILTALIGVFA